jgi:tRNA threonylcarbamoyladenosine biosynthesis protein TsaE
MSAEAAWRVTLPDPAATHALGLALGRTVDGPVHVALVGGLGAGKTALAQGVGAGLAVETEITSPTFVLVAEHQGRLPLLHADLYRLRPEEVDELGLDEQALRWPGPVLVEWPDRAPEVLCEDHVLVQLVPDGTGRQARVWATGARGRAVVDRWRTAWEAR